MIKITEEHKQFLRDNYATMENAELAKVIGCCSSCVDYWAKRLELKKPKEYIEAQRLNALKNAKNKWMYNEEKRSVVGKKISESNKKMYAAEKRRVLFGLPQRTSHKVVKSSLQKYRQRGWLKSHDYILDEHLRIAYWTEQTKRCVRLEKNGSQFYKFKEYEDRSKQSDGLD